MITDIKARPKILFTDLDDTLLRSDKKISSFTFDVLKRWTEAGNFLCLNSGRDVNSVYKVYKDISLDRLKNVFVIGYNGGQIFDCDKNETIYKVTIPIESVSYIENKAREYNIYFQTYSEKNIIAPATTKELTYYQRTIKTPVIFHPNIAASLTEEPCKCICIELTDKERLEALRLSLVEWADKNNITLLYSNDKYLEIFPASSGKGVALKYLTKHLGIDDLISVAAGDEQNDVSMLEAADYSIGMCNGKDTVKKAATVVTDADNDNDGLAKAILEIF